MSAKKCRYCGKKSCSEKNVFAIRREKGWWSIFVSGTESLVFGSSSRKTTKELADKLEALVAEAFNA